MRAGLALAAVTATVLAVPSSAVGAGLNPTSKKVVSANASVSTCGTLSGMTITWTVVDDVVSSITLGSIPAGCSGGLLSMTLASSSNTPVGNIASVTLTGAATQTITPTGTPSALAVSTSYVSVVGP